MPSLPPKQQCQSTEGQNHRPSKWRLKITNNEWLHNILHSTLFYSTDILTKTQFKDFQKLSKCNSRVRGPRCFSRTFHAREPWEKQPAPLMFKQNNNNWLPLTFFTVCSLKWLIISLHFNGHFPGEPGLASVYWSKDNGSGGDNWSHKSCKAPVKSSPPTNQHPAFLQARCPSCRPTNNVKALKGKISHSMDLLTPSSPGVIQLCLWPLIAPGYLGGGLPCLSSALWCQYPTLQQYVSGPCNVT